ncbi:hypothetical protein BGZ82_009513, partial [Podila clonocystis]
MNLFSGTKNTILLHIPIDLRFTNVIYTTVLQITRLRSPRQMRHVDLRLTHEMASMIVDLMNTGSTGTDIMATTVIARETEDGIGIVTVIGTETRK